MNILTSSGLDYEIIYSPEEGDWTIWTPDKTGACIGSGKTADEARVHAMAYLGFTIGHLAEQCSAKLL